MKRILHVFSTMEVGGPQIRFATFINSGTSSYVNSIYAMDGCYDALNLIPGMDEPPRDKNPIPKGQTLKAVRACRARLSHDRPDLLVTYNWGAIEWALANRIFPLAPMIHVQDGFGADEQQVELPRRRMLRRIAYSGCKKVIVPSQALYKIAEDNWHIPDAKLVHIPNGIDTSRFGGQADNQLLAKHGLEPQHTIIGTVAGLRPEKNIGRLIEAFAGLSFRDDSLRLVIAGDGVGRPALSMLCERTGLTDKVIFTGNLEQPEAILPAFDIFAMSSDTEQMPIAVLEAMAVGLPIASTDVGDIASMVAKENRDYINGRGHKELFTNLLGLLEKTTLRKTIGEANKRRVEQHFTQETMIAAYNNLFQDILN